MSGETFHTTKEDIRKAESQVSDRHGGNIPRDSNVAQMKVINSPFYKPIKWLIPYMLTPSVKQSIIDENQDKDAEINQRKANLPLPEQPPVASDFNSTDQSTVNVGSGRFSGAVASDEEASGLRGPATADSSVRTSAEEWKTHTTPSSNVGRQGKEGLEGLPNDAKKR